MSSEAARRGHGARVAPPVATATARFARRLLSLAAREASLLSVLAVTAVVVVGSLPYELVQDSWLTLVSGREVITNGLPHVDTLTAWTLGVEWIDQQWLAQSSFYGLYLAGGIKLVLLIHAATLVGAVALAMAAARSLGATRRSVWIAVAASLPLAPWALQMRSQTLAVPLFVGLVWLLAADSRRPSRWVLLALPILVLWANVHGTVVLGALLVGLRGATAVVGAVRRTEPTASGRRGALLLTAAPACVLASPYGFELIDYYRSLLLNPMLKSLVEEWGVSSPSRVTALFYLFAFASVALLARQRRRLTGFEQLVLVGTLAAGIASLRSIIWFALAAAVLVPVLLDGELRHAEGHRPERPSRTLLGLVALATIVIAGVAAALQPQSWYASRWPEATASRVGSLAAARPDALVLADDRVSDWLLWEQPQLAGRVAHDVRFELFSDNQFRQLSAFRTRTGEQWQQLAAGYGILAFDPVRSRTLIRGLVGSGDYRKAFENELLVVLARR